MLRRLLSFWRTYTAKKRSIYYQNLVCSAFRPQVHAHGQFALTHARLAAEIGWRGKGK